MLRANHGLKHKYIFLMVDYKIALIFFITPQTGVKDASVFFELLLNILFWLSKRPEVLILTSRIRNRNNA